MNGLFFETASPPVRSDPARADVALFVGFVDLRLDAASGRKRLERALNSLGWSGPPLPVHARVVPDNVRPSGKSPDAFAAWLKGLGWNPTRLSPSPTAADDLFRAAMEIFASPPLTAWWVERGWIAPASSRRAADLLELFDVPIPVDTWDTFESLFLWDRRPLQENAGGLCNSTLGAAVRRFFAQGGRKCYVVRAGGTWPVLSDFAQRAGLWSRILPTFPEPSPAEQSTWRGVGHLFGLPDISFLAIPDLPELFSLKPGTAPSEPVPETAEVFIECGTRVDPPVSRSLRAFPFPRSGPEEFRNWSAFVRKIGSLLERHCREVQLVAAVPQAADESVFSGNPELAALRPEEFRANIATRVFKSRAAQWQHTADIQTAFVQLAYPWLRTRESTRLPGAVEPPDAMLMGMLANSALTRGAWRSAAREPATEVIGVEPVLAAGDLGRPLPFTGATGAMRVPRTLIERISVFGPSPLGFLLLSDVTTDDDEAYRPASVNRLVAALVRAARIEGEQSTFLNNGEALWRRLKTSLEDLLLRLWGAGALAGSSAREAFEVRCDRTSMTQADIDSGRTIARVQFLAASPIERITVVLALDEGGQVNTVTPDTEGAA